MSSMCATNSRGVGAQLNRPISQTEVSSQMLPCSVFMSPRGIVIWCHWPSTALGSYFARLPTSLPHLSLFAQRRPTRIPSAAGATSGEAGTIFSWNFRFLRPLMFVAPAAYHEVQFHPKPRKPLPLPLNSSPMLPFAPIFGAGSRVAVQGWVSHEAHCLAVGFTSSPFQIATGFERSPGSVVAAAPAGAAGAALDM